MGLWQGNRCNSVIATGVEVPFVILMILESSTFRFLHIRSVDCCQCIGFEPGGKSFVDMFGGEADRVVVVGRGYLEAISRARVSLAVLLCCPNESSRKHYNNQAAGYRAAIEQGLVEVAIPPWHPQVLVNFLLKEPIPFKK